MKQELFMEAYQAATFHGQIVLQTVLRNYQFKISNELIKGNELRSIAGSKFSLKHMPRLIFMESS
jgi:hypothetical protein